MKCVIAIIALTLIGTVPTFAGSATYSRPGSSSIDDAIKTCQPRINDAQDALISMRLPATNARGKQIMHELGEARTAMETGHAQECLAHVSNAAGLEH